VHGAGAQDIKLYSRKMIICPHHCNPGGFTYRPWHARADYFP
jgi:hypothetical protein